MNTYFKSKIQENVFIAVILLSFIAFNVETDIYTPSFPEMVSYFSCSEEAIQLLLSMNFLGLCLSSLFFGPASDAYGRKTILTIGLGIFTLGSIGCAWTDALDLMILFRFIQGLGCGAIVSAGLTCFFDVYPADKSSRLVAICNGVIGGFMALAPMLGSWITIHMGWRTNFYVIAILATSAFLSTLLLINETHPKEKRSRFNLPTIIKNYLSIVTNFAFMAHTLIWCLMFSMVIVMIANLSLIFIDYLKVSSQEFGYYQAAIMATFFVGSMVSASMIKKYGMMFAKVFGSAVYLAGIAGLVFLAFFDPASPRLLIIAMSLASLGSALSCTIYFTFAATHIDKSLQGSSMSLTQSMRLSLSSFMVYLGASSFNGSVMPMTLLGIASTVICLLCYTTLYKRKQHLASSVQEMTSVSVAV